MAHIAITLKPGIYRHYKGNLYRVIGIARHSETLEELVVYEGLYVSPDVGFHPLWVRPKSMFLDLVEVDGQSVPRFKYIKE